jgi:ClpP class serine protease
VNTKALLQTIYGIWLIEETAAYKWAEIAQLILSNNYQAQAPKAAYAYTANSAGTPVLNGETLVIPLNGPIIKYDYCGSAGTQSVMQVIQAAKRNPYIQSIVLNIDSPGGTVNGTEDLAAEIASSKKPIVAFANGMMASAAYWIGSSAKEIIISGHTTFVGSIGTMAVLQKNADKSEQVLVASKSTRKNKTYMDAMNGDTEAYVKQVLDPLNETFLSAVQKNRAGKINIAQENVLEGDTYIGKQAIQVGLADSMGNLQYAIKRSLQLAKTI